MNRRALLVTTAAASLTLAAPAGGAVLSPTVRLVIAHVASHCHVWRTSTKTLGASTTISVTPGTKLVVRSDCPMDFDLAQNRGPRLPLGDPRMLAGTSRTIAFRRVGVYVLTATNVQTPEERGLVTLGEPNTLILTVIVTRSR
jgi:hypothetical protein